MTSRRCPRGCAFCHVAAKEGRCSQKVADVKDFWNGQKEIRILDPNITACRERFDLYQQYIDTGAKLDFTQGLDIRLITDRDMEYINRMHLKRLHFAWDNPNDDLEERFRFFKDRFRRKTHLGTVYILTGYGSTMEENLHRIYTVSGLGYDPYVMVYNKPAADKELRALQRWCNNVKIFKTCRRFEDYYD